MDFINYDELIWELCTNPSSSAFIRRGEDTERHRKNDVTVEADTGLVSL